MTKQHPTFQTSIQRGLTLIELLVVVTILLVMTAVMIPQLRIINEDRNIREAARVVSSLFATASNRAAAEGGAGVLLERHPNFLDGGLEYAATTMYVMRNVPPYAGDDVGATANVTGPLTVTIPTPLEHTPTQALILENDLISFNNNSAKYLIINIGPSSAGKIVLTLSNSGYLPTPPDNVPFVIHRQPRKLESSRVEMPEGYLIDLRFSGPLTAGGVADFNTAPLAGINVLFNAKGGIDRYYYSTGPEPLPEGTLYLFVAKLELEGDIPLEQPNNMWVTVNNTTGGVNVGYNAPPVVTPGSILEARNIASQQQSASQ